jgi:hypothetical protein
MSHTLIPCDCRTTPCSCHPSCSWSATFYRTRTDDQDQYARVVWEDGSVHWFSRWCSIEVGDPANSSVHFSLELLPCKPAPRFCARIDANRGRQLAALFIRD